MRFTLTIDCDNAAFGDSYTQRDAAVAELMRRAAEYVESARYSFELPNVLLDANGNTVGQFGFEEDN